jgi:lipooligosaccharide transport system permease protein
MVTVALAPRLLRRLNGSARRSGSVAVRNIDALRSGSWLVLISGFFEPLVYLLSIGIGVGALIGDVRLADGRSVPYATFVAPAMLAASAMNGALAECTYNFYGKMKFVHLYEAILATPVRPMEAALGELLWAMLRGSVYSVAFLVVMTAMGMTSPGWALAAFPAALLIGFAFGAFGMWLATLMRSWQDFDLIAVVQFALFLFSGTFAPVTAYPLGVRLAIEASPLYRSVELVRGLALGSVHAMLALDAAYLIALACLGLWLASRRMSRHLLT